MSGGVDSSATAALLKKRGYDVIGFTLQLLPKEQETTSACGNLDGVTPNPCVECNRHIKFDALMEKARELDADFVATGHYRRRVYNPHTKQYMMKMAYNGNKDQSYFLYMLTQETLRQTLFPLGKFTKPQIRQMATEWGLINADKADSQGIGIAAADPLYVVGFDTKEKRVTVGNRDVLKFHKIHVAKWTPVNPNEVLLGRTVDIKTRYQIAPIKATISSVSDTEIVMGFLAPQAFQSPVMYDKTVLLGPAASQSQHNQSCLYVS